MNVIDFRGATHTDKIVGLVPSTVYQNGTFFLTKNTSYPVFKGYGSLGATTKIVDQSSLHIQVEDSSIIDKNDDILLVNLKGNPYSTLDAGKYGMWAKVLGKEGNRVYLDRFLEDYTVDTLYVPRMLNNITLRNLDIYIEEGFPIDYGIRIYAGRNIRLENVTVNGAKFSGISLETCLDSSVSSCYVSRGDHLTGQAYGVSIVGGCEGITVSGGSYKDLRHGITIGGTEATSRNITITGVTTTACSDAGIDVHPNCMGAVISNNVINGSSSEVSQTGDGICVQNTNAIISNNIINQVRREGILVQPLTRSDTSNFIMSNNIINNARYGILVDSYYNKNMNVNVVNNIVNSIGRQIQLQGGPYMGGELTATVIGDHKLIADGRNTKITLINTQIAELVKFGDVVEK